MQFIIIIYKHKHSLSAHLLHRIMLIWINYLLEYVVNRILRMIQFSTLCCIYRKMCSVTMCLTVLNMHFYYAPFHIFEGCNLFIPFAFIVVKILNNKMYAVQIFISANALVNQMHLCVHFRKNNNKMKSALTFITRHSLDIVWMALQPQ